MKFTQNLIMKKLLLKSPNLILDSKGLSFIVIDYCEQQYCMVSEILLILINSA